MRGGRKRGVDGGGVAEVIVERNVARNVVVQQRRARARGVFQADDGGERIDIDLDGFGRILGGEHGLGDHASDGIADVAHLVLGERAAPRLFQRRAVTAFERHIAFQRAVALEIRGGIDREHSRHFPGRLGIDGAEHAVRVAAAHHHGVGLAGKADIIGIAAVTPKQHRIFDARHRLAHGKFLDRQLPRAQFFGRLFGRLMQIHEWAIPGGLICR